VVVLWVCFREGVSAGTTYPSTPYPTHIFINPPNLHNPKPQKIKKKNKKKKKNHQTQNPTQKTSKTTKQTKNKHNKHHKYKQKHKKKPKIKKEKKKKTKTKKKKQKNKTTNTQQQKTKTTTKTRAAGGLLELGPFLFFFWNPFYCPCVPLPGAFTMSDMGSRPPSGVLHNPLVS